LRDLRVTSGAPKAAGCENPAPSGHRGHKPQPPDIDHPSTMALHQLTDEQIKTWTRVQKDEWWLTTVYRGDMAQLTLRSAVTGFLLGGILAATAMYILAKTGIGIGVGLTSVLLSFAMFRAMSNAGLAKDFTVLENNCTQSIATSAGYVIAPLGAGLTTYMVMTGNVL